MSYDMKKMDNEKWNYYKNIIKINKKKLSNPFYTKKEFIKEVYKNNMGEELDFKCIETFDQKLNANKANSKKMRIYSKYADKNKVRAYVKEKIGEKYLIKQYFAKKKICAADLEKLPSSFVLKTNNGSGTNYIVLDKDKEDLNKICDYMNSLLEIKYGYIFGEFLYNYIRPKIVAERLMIDKNKNIPDDLKCFCFQDNAGNKKKILYEERVVGDERERIMFDENWNIINLKSSFKKLNTKIKKPKNYKEILKVIDKLSEDFNFVRVDLYLFNNKIYFGELTFTPTAGYLKFDDKSIDKTWGNYIGDNKL